MTIMAQLKVSVSTSKVGSRVEATLPVDDADLEEMSKGDKDRYLIELLEQWVWDHVNAHAEWVE